MSDKPIYKKIMKDIEDVTLPGPIYGMDVKHINNPDKLHQIADSSHQEHKAVTGQVPNVDPEDMGYTTYEHKGSYYQPGSDD
jgi:hypothetical protein